MTCCSLRTLQKYLKYQLAPGLHEDVTAHLYTCQDCTERLAALQIPEALLHTFPPDQGVVPDGCAAYGAEERIAYADKLLTPQDTVAFEQHLQTCDSCLCEVMAIRRMRAYVVPERLLTPPADLVATVRKGLKPDSVIDQLGRIIVQVTQNGLKCLSAMALASHVRVTVNGPTLATAGSRGTVGDTEEAAALAVQHTVGDLEIHLHVLHEQQDTVLLTVHLKKQGQPVVRQRVSLLRQGRIVYSGSTSAAGEVEFARVSPGEYSVRIPQEKVETSCIFQTASAPAQTG